jgi:hypothetical protein
MRQKFLAFMRGIAAPESLLTIQIRRQVDPFPGG